MTPRECPISYLKKTPLCFRRIIVELFNKYLNENVLPTKWKKSIVKMIEKKADDHNNPNNYRPISITSCLCRLMREDILINFFKHPKPSKTVIWQKNKLFFKLLYYFLIFCE